MNKTRYLITYRDEDPGCPTFSFVVYAENEEHALMQWDESNELDGGGWVLESVSKP